MACVRCCDTFVQQPSTLMKPLALTEPLWRRHYPVKLWLNNWLGPLGPPAPQPHLRRVCCPVAPWKKHQKQRWPCELVFTKINMHDDAEEIFRGLSPVFPTHSLWPYFLASFCRISLWEKLVGKKLLLPVKSQKLLLFSLHYYTLCSCWEKQVFVRREKVGVRNLESLRRWAPPPICRTPRIWKLVRAKAF
jgi:hypothetical protein